MPDNHAPTRTTNRPLPANRLMLLLAIGLAIHFAFGWLLTLSVDEAHYAYYAARLDWSYFDHPPLVGWAQWPLVAIGAPDGLIRLVPQLLWLLACLQAYQLTQHLCAIRATAGDRDIDPDTAGLWAVGLILLAPVMHVLAVGLLPDTLLMVITMGLMRSCIQLCDPSHAKHTGPWLWLGVLLGLAGLAKYTAVFPALALTILLAMQHGPHLLKRPGPWLAMLIGAVMVSPVFYWNAVHDWISFLYQINHGAGGSWKLRRFLAFFAVQLVSYGPLLVLGTIWALMSIKKHPSRLQFGLLLFFLIPFVITAYLSGGGGSLPHWTAPAWLAVTPFAAIAITSHWHGSAQRLIRTLVWVQGVICVSAFVILFSAGLPGVSQSDSLGKKNPIADLWGWDEAGKLAQSLSEKLRVDTLTVRNWTLASRLAWYARPMPVVVIDKRIDQFDLWFGTMQPGRDALFVNWSQMPFALPVQDDQFRSCIEVGRLDIRRLGRVISDFSFFHCQDWQGKAAEASK